MSKTKRRSGGKRNSNLALATAILALATSLVNLVDRVLQTLEPR